MPEQRPLVNYGEIVGPLGPDDYLPGAAYVFATKSEFDVSAPLIPVGARVVKLYEMTPPTTRYGFDEQKTGETWFDGRPIHRRTFVFTNTGTTNGTSVDMGTDVPGLLSPDLDFIIRSEVLSYERLDYSMEDNSYHTASVPASLVVAKTSDVSWEMYLQIPSGIGTNTFLVVTAWYLKRYSLDSGQIFVTHGEYDLPIPEGVRAIDVTLVGCGGAPGKAYRTASFGRTGGGGGSGYVTRVSLDVTPLETLTVVLPQALDDVPASPAMILRGLETLALAAAGEDGGDATATANGVGGAGQNRGGDGALVTLGDLSGSKVAGGAGGAPFCLFYGQGGTGQGLYSLNGNLVTWTGDGTGERSFAMALVLWRQ
jgi:hypothetical protein